jgi:hypothetical protein
MSNTTQPDELMKAIQDKNGNVSGVWMLADTITPTFKHLLEADKQLDRVAVDLRNHSNQQVILDHLVKKANPEDRDFFMSNKLLKEINSGNLTGVRSLVTKDPQNPDKYIVPVTKPCLASARYVRDGKNPEAANTANEIVSVLETAYLANKKEKLLSGAIQKQTPDRVFSTQSKQTAINQ